MRGNLSVFLAIGLLFADDGSLPGEELKQETIQKITAYLQEARSHSLQKEYAKSNALYEKAMELLPPVKEGSLEASRAKLHFDIGCNWALQGRKPEAIAALGRAVSHGYWHADYLLRDPTLKELHTDKKFHAVMQEAKLGFSRMVVGLTDVLTNKKVEARDLENKVLIIDIWGTWCPPCRREIPYFVKLKQKYAAQGLEIVGLTYEREGPSDEARKRVEDFGKEQSVNYPLVMLAEDLRALLSGLHGVRKFPTTYFFGRDGSLKHRLEGLQDLEVLEAKVIELLSKK